MDLIVVHVLFDYRVEQVVKQFGEPEGVYQFIRKNSDPHTTFVPEKTPVALPSLSASKVCTCDKRTDQLGLEDTDYFLDLLYPSKGLSFRVPSLWSDKDCICPKMLVSTAVFFKPVSLTHAFTDDYLATLLGADYLRGVREEDLRTWHGFGSGY